MSKAGKLVKGMLKTKKESVMGQLGDAPYENPWEPWSSKYGSPVKNEEVQIDELSDKTLTSYAQKVHDDSLKHDKDPSKRSAEKRNKSVMGFSRAVNKLEARPQKEEVETLEEDSWLFSYIKSLGYNPKIMNFAQRSKYARSNAFKHWKQSHMERRAGQTAAMEETDVEESWHAGSGKHPMAFKSAYDKGKQWDEGPDKHAVHINGKKWKTFDSQSHAQNVAKKIKGATVHKEEVEQIEEAGTGLLMTYIKAKGLNPLTMDGNQKHAYARSSEFKVFKQKHAKVKKEEFERLVGTYGAENLAELVMQIQEVSGMGERGDDWNEGFQGNPAKEGQVAAGGGTPADKAKLAAKYEKKKEKKQVKEEADKADTVTMDIPLLIRVLEYAREDAKTDMDLHKVVENLIKMRDGGTLSMAEYDKIVAIKEEIEAKYGKDYQDMVKRVGQKAAQKPVDMKSLAARMQASYAKDKKPLKELKKMPDNMDSEDHITREANEMKGKDPCWKGYQMVGTKKKGGRTVPNCVPEQVQEGIGNAEDPPMSATNSVKAMESAHRSKQMKSARMIKSLYKNKIKETTYDWEKDDKPNAKIVVKGGTTMTGQPRDTVEIEPVLRTRPNQVKPTV